VESGDASIAAHHEEIKERFLKHHKDQLDGVEFWGDACTYQCVWVRQHNDWRCEWYLVVPGEGGAMEHSGFYDSRRPPGEFKHD